MRGREGISTTPFCQDEGKRRVLEAEVLRVWDRIESDGGWGMRKIKGKGFDA
jgi:hypothetical protein